MIIPRPIKNVGIRPVLRRIARVIETPFAKAWTKRVFITREEFTDDLEHAIAAGESRCIGKIPHSERLTLMADEILQKNQKKTTDRLNFHFGNQEGLFPVTPKFILEYRDFYIEHCRNLDHIGLLGIRKRYPISVVFQQKRMLCRLKLRGKKMDYSVHEFSPPTLIPVDPRQSYLNAFKGKKILIVCPFAELLKARANKETFEGAWSKIGFEWFYPQSVEAIEFPYGFSKETQAQYGNAIHLFRNITDRMDSTDYDICLIGAAGLGIPLASHAKNRGKIGFSMGGILQILFGVLGKRWRERADWMERNVNEHWINMPERYKPKELAEGLEVCDNGAYW